MEIQELTVAEEKQKVVRQILEGLPEWFGKLSKHLRISADDEDDDDIAVELPEGDISEGPQEIDPRWNELKKILDNN